MALITVYNGPAPTTAAQVKQPTGTAIRTLLQVKPIIPMRIVEWGIAFDASASGTPGTVELLDTGTVAATALTASVEADIVKTDGADLAAASSVILTLGTGATGYASSAPTEGTITAVRMFDAMPMQPTDRYLKQWPLGREPKLLAANYMRVRATFGTTVNCICWVTLEY